MIISTEIRFSLVYYNVANDMTVGITLTIISPMEAASTNILR